MCARNPTTDVKMLGVFWKSFWRVTAVVPGMSETTRPYSPASRSSPRLHNYLVVIAN